MKNKITNFLSAICVASALGCVDNSFEEYPNDDNFPLLLVLDAEEGADLPDAEDVSIELKLADYLPSQNLPNTPITLSYSITDLEEDMVGNVTVDKVIYEVEVDDCTYERELAFESASDGLSGTINIAPDSELGSIPESFEVILKLPGLEDTSGEFTVEFSNLQSTENLQLGFPNTFKYEVLDNDVAGEWEMEISSSDAFEDFKSVFGAINPELDALTYEEITGKIGAEFEFGEMKFIIELEETEEITTCEDGEEETEIVNKEIEIEADYDAEDGEIEFEGSHLVINDDGVVEGELDFIMNGSYTVLNDESVSYSFFSVIDEENFADGEELFTSEEGVSFTFKKD